MNRYVCICGKEFDEPQKFNGHKSHCKIHQFNKYGNLNKLNLSNNIRNTNAYNARVTLYDSVRKNEMDKWISEQHTCEKCGKIMTEKFGSGRFCSRQCANSRVKSEESKLKVSETLHNNALMLYNTNPVNCVTCGNPLPYEKRHLNYCSKDCIPKPVRKVDRESKYYNSPRYCELCGSIIPYQHRHRTYCNDECRYKALSIKQRKNYKEGKLDHITVNHTYKYGTYKGVSCDSSWELAFVIYNIEHNINFIRNKTISFEYQYKGETHNFFPDFIVDGTFVEIKNRHSELTDCKINDIPKDVKFKILYSKDIKKYLDYVFDKYGPNWVEMYDRNYPSWLDKVE